MPPPQGFPELQCARQCAIGCADGCQATKPRRTAAEQRAYLDRLVKPRVEELAPELDEAMVEAGRRTGANHPVSLCLLILLVLTDARCDAARLIRLWGEFGCEFV